MEIMFLFSLYLNAIQKGLTEHHFVKFEKGVH